MDKFFTNNITTKPFVIFSTVHILTVLVICLLNVGLILFFKKCKNKSTLDIFSYFLAALMLLNEFSYIIWSILSGDWSVEFSLPLQLSEILTFLLVYMLITKNYIAFEVAYFITFGAALQALLTPDLYYPFPHYRFFNFFLSHGLMFTAIFYMLIVKQYIPTFKSIGKTLLYLNIYMIILLPINLLTGGNYMFLMKKPVGGSILDILGPWPWYLLSLEFVASIILFLCYLPFVLINKYSRKKKDDVYKMKKIIILIFSYLKPYEK